MPSAETERAASDAREERMDRVAVLYGEITSATREFLAAVAACDRHRDWAEAGFGSCAEWLAWRIGITRNTANGKVRVALALEDLPQTSEAMSRGELSFTKVRALTRVATPASEPELLALARSVSAARLERLIRAWRVDGRLRHRSRTFSVFPDGEGTYFVRGRLTPEIAAVLLRAVEAAADALFGSGADEESTPEQRRADALGLLAERALAAGFGEGDAPPVSGSRAERYQVLLHVDHATLSEDGEPCRSELEDGTRVTAEGI